MQRFTRIAATLLVLAVFIVPGVFANEGITYPRPGYLVQEHPPALTAHDGGTLAGQAEDVRTGYAAAYGADAPARWVIDHHRNLVGIEARIRIAADPNTPDVLESLELDVDTVVGNVQADVMNRGAAYAFLVGCDDGVLWGLFGCGITEQEEDEGASQDGSSSSGDSGSSSGGSGTSSGSTSETGDTPVASTDFWGRTDWSEACDHFLRRSVGGPDDDRMLVLIEPTERVWFARHMVNGNWVAGRHVELLHHPVEGDINVCQREVTDQDSQRSSVAERDTTEGASVTRGSDDDSLDPPPPPSEERACVLHIGWYRGGMDEARKDRYEGFGSWNTGRTVWTSDRDRPTYCDTAPRANDYPDYRRWETSDGGTTWQHRVWRTPLVASA